MAGQTCRSECPTADGRLNHSVTNCAPLQLPERELLATDLSLALAMLIVTAGFLLVHGASVPFLLLYGPLHVALLVPVRVYALATLASPRWETR